jgi:hypothetical protein
MDAVAARAEAYRKFQAAKVEGDASDATEPPQVDSIREIEESMGSSSQGVGVDGHEHLRESVTSVQEALRRAQDSLDSSATTLTSEIEEGPAQTPGLGRALHAIPASKATPEFLAAASPCSLA